MNIENMKKFWRSKESLNLFLSDEIFRAQTLINNKPFKKSSNHKHLRSLFKNCELTSCWINDFLSFFPEYKKSSPIFCEKIKINTWPKLQKEEIEDQHADYMTKGGFSSTEKMFFKQNGVLGPIKINTFKSKNFSFLKELIVHSGDKSNYLFQSKDMLNLAANGEILSKVQSLLGKDVVILDDTVLLINPGQNVDVTHSDVQGHASLLGDQFFRNDPGVLNVWISVSGTNDLKSPLHFFPGSHHFPIIPSLEHLRVICRHPEKAFYYSNLFSFLGKEEHNRRAHRLHMETLKEVFHEIYLERYIRQEIYTEPGECIFFNSHVLHGTSKNVSDSPRISIVFRYRKATAKPLAEGSPFLCFQIKQKDKNGMKEIPVIQILGNKHHSSYQIANTE